MPDPHLLPAFVLAVAMLMLTPGPNVALIVANSLAYGARWGVFTAIATGSASVVQLLLVSAGMATVVGQLGEWFGLLRWAGVAYLIAIGIQQWRAAPPALEAGRPGPRSMRAIATRAVTVSVLNPKTLLFYAAFFPQFIATDRPAGPQLAALATLYLAMALVIDSLWALGAARIRRILGARPRLFNRLSGSILITAGLGVALQRAR